MQSALSMNRLLLAAGAACLFGAAGPLAAAPRAVLLVQDAPSPQAPTKEDAEGAADALIAKLPIFMPEKKEETVDLMVKFQRHVSHRERLGWRREQELINGLMGGTGPRLEGARLLKGAGLHKAWAREHFRGKLVDRLRFEIIPMHPALVWASYHRLATAIDLTDQLIASL
jgi:hypothetical protein